MRTKTPRHTAGIMPAVVRSSRFSVPRTAGILPAPRTAGILPAIHPVRKLPALLTLLTLALAAPTLRADDVLDRALGDNPTPATQPAAKPADQPAPLNPAAARAVDDDELTKKLTGQDNGAAGNPMAEVIDRMGDAAKRLNSQDTGAVTQETQKRIILNLDQLIEIARKQQQSGSSGKSNGPPKPGEQRTQSSGKGNQKGPPQQNSGNTAATDSQLPGGDAATPELSGKDIHEKDAEWAHLPERDRDLIIHGSKEEALPAYKEMVQRYYQALAEIGKSNANR